MEKIQSPHEMRLHYYRIVGFEGYIQLVTAYRVQLQGRGKVQVCVLSHDPLKGAVRHSPLGCFWSVVCWSTRTGTHL